MSRPAKSQKHLQNLLERKPNSRGFQGLASMAIITMTHLKLMSHTFEKVHPYQRSG